MHRDENLVSRLIDGELGPVRAWLARRHVARCAGCARLFEADRALSAALEAGLPRHRASPGLAERITLSLPQAVPPRRKTTWLPAAGVGFGGALAGVALTLLVQTGIDRSASTTFARLAIDAHTAAAPHEIDIADSDRHVVKPWLSARIDVSPPVRDLRAFGFFLVGGRIDHLRTQPAAVVVYRRDNHRIDVFAWPADKPDATPAVESRKGFNSVSWRRGGTAFAAVSDLEAGELLGFVGRLSEGT